MAFKIDSERTLIYFAVSNLIKDCYEFLESIPNDQIGNFPKEDLDIINDILIIALPLEEKLAKELGLTDEAIQRPDWDDL